MDRTMIRARGVSLVLLALLLVSCATSDTSPPEGEQPAPFTVKFESAASDAGDGGAPDDSIASNEASRRRVLQVGTDIGVNMPPARPPIRLDGEAVSLDFEQSPLIEVVHAILGDILELDYVVEHPINGQVTLRTRSPIPRDELLPILESLLQSNGAYMVRGPQDRYFVSSSAKISKVMPAFGNPSSQGAGFSNVIVPLEYIGAAEMADILRPVATDEAFVRIDTRRNLLVLAGTRTQLDGWMQIIETFDIDQLQGMSVAVFPLQYSAVDIVDAALQELIGGASGSGGAASSPEGAVQQGVESALGSVVRTLPLKALNSILVISPRLSHVQRVAEWVEKLDQPMDTDGEATLHVYSVQNGDATQMAQLLSGLLGGGGGAAGGPMDAGIAPGLTPMSTGATGGAAVGGAAAAAGAGRNARARGPGAGAQFSIGEDVRVVADGYNNSLLIFAPLREYRKIEAALKKLDVVPKQVLIEASILEVQLIDDLRYGLEWTFKDSINGDTGTGLLQLGDNPIGPRVPGFSYTLTDSADAVRAVVNALAEKSLVNVISTPSIMVLDNYTASIQVGDQQPIQSGQTVTNGGVINTAIEYKDTGVQLQVTPTVNAGGLVTMTIAQSVTDVGVVDSATGQRSFLTRDVASRIAIRSGESVVLGGLIRDNRTTGNSGIPLLKDIPGLGALFGGTTKTATRTELLVFITPRVMRDQNDLRDITVEMRNRMKGIPYFEDLPASARPEAREVAVPQT